MQCKFAAVVGLLVISNSFSEFKNCKFGDMQGTFPNQLCDSFNNMARRMRYFHLAKKLKEVQECQSEEETKIQREREKFCSENSDIVENGSYKWQKLEGNRILFYGPPGNGKTTIARKFAEMMDAELIELSGSEIVTRWLNGGADNIKKTFEDAEKIMEEGKTVVLFIDEIDVIVSESNTEMRSEHAIATTDLLKRLDSIKNNPRIVFVCATNHFEKLDNAFKKRMSYQIEFENPDKEVRSQILEYYFKEEKVDLRDIPWSSWWVVPICGASRRRELREKDLFDKLLAKTENLSSRELEIFANNVSNYLKQYSEIDESTLMSLVPSPSATGIQSSALDKIEKVTRITSNISSAGAAGVVIWKNLPDGTKTQVVEKIMALFKDLLN